MLPRRLRLGLFAVTAALGLSACSTYDDYGYGRSYASLGVGYGSSYGWYDGFYYPGSGYYVFDRQGRRHSWNDNQRRYWMNRARTPEDRREVRRNYREFRADRQGDRTRFQAERQANREALRSGQITREQFRDERRDDRRSFRQERQDDRRSLFRENRRAVRNRN